MTARAWRAGGPVRGVVLGLVALGLAWVSTRGALVQSFARSSPEFALRLDPTDGVALNARFQKSLDGQAMAPAQLGSWAARARASLSVAALSPSMVRLSSIDPTRSPSQSQALLDLAERISRRDALTQLALVEAAVNAGQIGTALEHYDRALSIYPDLRPTLFPILTGAIAEPKVRNGIAQIARRRRPWMEAFLNFAVHKADATQAVEALLAGLDHGKGALPSAREHEAVLASRMAGEGQYINALQLAKRAAGANAAWIDLPGFAPANWVTSARPLTWSVSEKEGVYAQLQANHSVLVTIGPGASELAMFRVLVMRPGRYLFTTSFSRPGDTAPAGGRWELVCLRPKGQSASSIGEVRIGSNEARSAETLVVVPADCNAVRIGFTIDNIDGGSDAGIVLRDVSFAPIR